MELLHVADSVAREKNIDQDVVLVAMEEAIQKAGRSKYGYDQDIRAHIDRKIGVIKLERFRLVVKEINEEESEAAQILFSEAKKLTKTSKLAPTLWTSCRQLISAVSPHKQPSK